MTWAHFDYRCMEEVVAEAANEYRENVADLWSKRPKDTTPHVYRRMAYRHISLCCGVNAVFNGRHLIKVALDEVDRNVKGATT